MNIDAKINVSVDGIEEMTELIKQAEQQAKALKDTLYRLSGERLTLNVTKAGQKETPSDESNGEMS